MAAPTPRPPRNFSFTSEIRTWFEFAGTEIFTVGGDDDIWLFVHGRRAVDFGGVHGHHNGTLPLAQAAANPGLTVGGRHEVALFRAERHTTGSTLGFGIRPPPRSLCMK